jgi:thymidylate kinase
MPQWPSGQMKNYQLFFGICILGLLGILSLITPDVMMYLGWVILGAVLIAVVLGLAWFGFRIYLSVCRGYWEKEGVKSAITRQVITAPLGHQVFVQDDKGHAIYHALHLERRTYSNGRYEEPTPGEAAAWLQFNQPKKAIVNQELLLQDMKSANPKPQLLPLLERAWKVFLVGNEGSGKTTLLKALLGQHLNRGPVIVVDIHGHKDHWPGAKVVGTGYDLEGVMTTFDRFIAEIKYRYGLIAKEADAATKMTPITLICDEFSALVYNLKKNDYDVSEFMRMMATEVRKTNISFVFASHIETLTGTGMDGAAKLLDSFVRVKLAYDQISQERNYTVDLGDGQGPREVDNVLPLSSGISPPSLFDIGNLSEPTLSKDEEAILAYCDSVVHNPTRRELIIKVMKVSSDKVGSQHYVEVNRILEKLQRQGRLTTQRS